MHVHAIGFCRVVDKLAGNVVEHPMEGVRPTHHPMRLDFARRERLGKFVSDVRAADRDGRRSGLKPLRDSTRLIEILKIEDVLRAGPTGCGRRVGTTAGSDQQGVVRKLCRGRYRQPLDGVDPLDARVEA